MTWKSTPKIVSSPEYLEQHHFSGYKTEAEYKFIPVTDLNNFQKYSEVKIRYFNSCHTAWQCTAKDLKSDE